MFDAPSRTTTYVAPAEPIDVDQRYLFKLVKLEDEGVSKFADQSKGETFRNIRWHFRVANAESRAPILNVEGDAWEHVEWTSSKTGKNPKNGMVAKARVYIEALVGHPLEDDDITPDLANTLLERVATGFFEEKEVEAQDGSTYTKLKILRLTPFKKTPTTTAAPARPKQEAEAAPAF